MKRNLLIGASLAVFALFAPAAYAQKSCGSDSDCDYGNCRGGKCGNCGSDSDCKGHGNCRGGKCGNCGSDSDCNVGNCRSGRCGA